MSYASPLQNFQDWFTQQWAILWGTKIQPCQYQWLIGPYGNLNGIGEEFIQQLAQQENLEILRNQPNSGILNSFSELDLKPKDIERIHPEIIHFYENTDQYQLYFEIKWNPFFKPFGYLVNRLFSKRINQLFLPHQNSQKAELIISEIILLKNSQTGEVPYKFWLRKIESTQQIIYSGIYSTGQLPSGKKAVKAIFPLPNGNATVLLKPFVDERGNFHLISEGKKRGDAGFYFLLKDAKGNNWAQYIKSFRDTLSIQVENQEMKAFQNLSLWRIPVLKIHYLISNR
jgi:hypothetical protein